MTPSPCRLLPHCLAGLSAVVLGCRRKALLRLRQTAWRSLGHEVLRDRERVEEGEEVEEGAEGEEGADAMSEGGEE